MTQIVGTRVDERLIHGQVATAWTNHLQANRIMVIDNTIITSSIDKMALKMACPANCKLSILSIEKAILNLTSEKYENDRIFIVCKKPKYFLDLVNAGIRFEKLILGNMSRKNDSSKMIRRSVYVSDEDIQEIEAIKEAGIPVYLQQTPADHGELFEL